MKKLLIAACVLSIAACAGTATKPVLTNSYGVESYSKTTREFGSDDAEMADIRGDLVQSCMTHMASQLTHVLNQGQYLKEDSSELFKVIAMRERKDMYQIYIAEGREQCSVLSHQHAEKIAKEENTKRWAMVSDFGKSMAKAAIVGLGICNIGACRFGVSK